MEQENTITGKKRRSPLLIILCICTFIWSGFMTIASLVSAIASRMLTPYIEEYVTDISFISNSITILTIIIFLFWLLSLIGAIRMMQLKRSGYVLYVIPNILMLVPQVALIRFLPLIHWGFYLYTINSVLFIILYAFCLKRMR